jgi:hypothetical protein
MSFIEQGSYLEARDGQYWGDIGRHHGITALEAMAAAKRHALTNNLPWPLDATARFKRRRELSPIIFANWYARRKR